MDWFIKASNAQLEPLRQLYVKADKLYPISSYEDASRKWSAMRDSAGFGASVLPGLDIVDKTGRTVAYVAYNGNVFEGRPQDWTSSTRLLYGKKFDPADFQTRQPTPRGLDPRHRTITP